VAYPAKHAGLTTIGAVSRGRNMTPEIETQQLVFGKTNSEAQPEAPPVNRKDDPAFLYFPITTVGRWDC
jgi:hypothetical protein